MTGGLYSLSRMLLSQKHSSSGAIEHAAIVVCVVMFLDLHLGPTVANAIEHAAIVLCVVMFLDLHVGPTVANA